MLFILPFALFIIILTLFENIFLALISRFLICVWIIIYCKIKKQNKIPIKNIWIITLALTISIISVFIKSYSYNKKISTISTSTWLIYQNWDWPQWQYFVWTWMISDIYSYHKYIFQDNAGREYFLKSTNTYKIWDEIWLNWYVSLWYTWSANIFHFAQQKNIFQNINSELFHYEFDYPKREMMKWYFWSITEQNSVLLNSSGDNISWIQKIRKSLQESIISAYGETPQAWLVLWMLVGDKSQIPSADYQNFIDSELVHIIAVSGGNIVMIVVFLSAILFFLPFYARNAVILITVICYSMICGLDSSVFRATVMGCLSLIALFRWREIDIWRAMWISFIVMLIINPFFLVYDVWFLLSYSAIIWIVFFQKFISNIQSKKEKTKSKKDDSITSKLKKFGQNCLSDYVVPTIWATLWVLPIMLFFMWWTNLLSIIANFFISPIIAIVMIYGFISTMLFKLIPRWIRIWPEKILIKYIYFISNLTVKRWFFLNAVWDRIKWALLILFIIWVILKTTKKDE